MSDRQATDLVILDIRPVSLMTDYFVIGTADSTRQMRAVASAVSDRVREEAEVKRVMADGEPGSGWMLIDFGDVIAHVFDPERREFYKLESLWDEAPLVARMA
jgi:ribosome-associated protein